MVGPQQNLETRCPIQYTLDLIGGKWSVPILRELFSGTRRTYQLLEVLPGISSKTLMIRLRELEGHGLIQRTIYPEVPPHVEYSLTEKGRQLQPVMLALYEVGRQWLQQRECMCAFEPEVIPEDCSAMPRALPSLRPGA